MDKKKIFAIALFLVMSLFLFSFANPEELEFVEFEEETPVAEQIEEPEPIEVEPVEQEEPQVLTPAPNTNSSSNTRRSSSSTNSSTNRRNTTNNNSNTNVSNNNSGNNSNNNGNNTNEPSVPIAPSAPVLNVVPNRVVLILGQDYNLMNGVTATSSENITVTSSVDNVRQLGVGTHTVTYTTTDSFNQRATATRIIVVLDPNGDEDQDGYTNKDEYDNEYSYIDANSHPSEPTLTLNGENPLTVLKSHIYNEPGYTYTVDSSDKETKGVTVTGEVNTDEIGNYTLTYKLVDKYGKEVIKTRTVNVKADINNNNIDDDFDDVYTVNFYDFNKQVIKEESVLIGMDATAPELEEIEGYVFVEWDSEYTNVQKNLEVYAIYEKDVNNNGIADSKDEIYNVKFFNINRELVKEENVLVGMDATAPVLGKVEKKIFLKWDTDYTAVNKDLEVHPVYGEDINDNGILDENDTRFTVKFYDNNQQLVKEERVLIGTSATAPTLDPVLNYIFIGWSEEFDKVEKDMDIYPLYGNDINNNGVLDDIDTTYTVKFYKKNNEVAKEENVLVGMDATAPELEDVDGYIFTGWSEEYTNVQSNLDIYPLYIDDKNHNGIDDTKEEHYTVTFKTNEFGSLNRIGLENVSEIKYENILTGLSFEEAGIVVPQVIENSGYYYIKWDKEFAKTVTEDLTYNAVYTYQDGIKVTKKDVNTNLTFQINSSKSAINESILVYRTYKDNLKQEELIDDYTTNFDTAKKGTYTLVVRDGEFTDSSLTYEIIKEKAYNTKFSIKYNTSKAYDRCSSDWDYNCTRLVHQPVLYNFLEITESYIGIVIDLNSAVVEYTDGTTDTISSGNFGLIRWESTTPSGNRRIPVYKTPALNDEGKTIKYVTINFTKKYKRYYIKFEYDNGEFVAIEGNEND